jgi:hypothetical protein
MRYTYISLGIETKVEGPNMAESVMNTEMKVKKHGTWKCSCCNHVSTSQNKYHEHHIHPQIKSFCLYCDRQFLSQKSLHHRIDEECFICEC